MASLFSELWPGILGAAATGIVIYLSLRGMAGSRAPVAVLQWRAELSESTRPEAGATPSTTPR